MPIDDKTAKGMQRIGDLFPAIIKPEHKPLSRIHERLISMPLQDEEAQSILYQHSVLCQTCMPYRDPAKPCGYGSARTAWSGWSFRPVVSSIRQPRISWTWACPSGRNPGLSSTT